jgi:hypothetical protein
VTALWVVLATLATVLLGLLVRGRRCRHKVMFGYRLKTGSSAVCWCGERFER